MKIHLRACRPFYAVTIFAIAVILLASSGLAVEDVTHKTLSVGEKAPLFKSFTIEGKPYDLKEYIGNGGVVLFFWSFFCGPCREEMPLIENLHQELKEKNIEIAAVNLDEVPLHNPIKNFLKTSGLTYTMVVNKFGENDAQLDKLYLVTGTPTIYLIKKDGTIGFVHVGRIEIADLKKAVTDNLLQSTN